MSAYDTVKIIHGEMYELYFLVTSAELLRRIWLRWKQIRR